jgi:hypothetical protein
MLTFGNLHRLVVASPELKALGIGCTRPQLRRMIDTRQIVPAVVDESGRFQFDERNAAQVMQILVERRRRIVARMERGLDDRLQQVRPAAPETAEVRP